MFDFDKNTKQYLTDIITLLGYLALGIALWQITNKLYIIIIYFLIILLLILFLRYRSAIKKINNLEMIINTAPISVEELESFQVLSQGMLALFFYITEKPITDNQHHYSFIQEEYIIRGDDGFYNWILKGYNDLNKPSSSLKIKLTGDTPVDSESLSFSVVDIHSKNNYDKKQLSILRDDPCLKVIEIKFPEPISPKKDFEIQLSCRWDNAFIRLRKHDYVFFPWGYYANQGIDRLRGRLVSDVPITSFILERLDAAQLLRESTQPKIVEASRNHFVIEWEIPNPHHCYILRFTKDIIKTKSQSLGDPYE